MAFGIDDFLMLAGGIGTVANTIGTVANAAGNVGRLFGVDFSNLFQEETNTESKSNYVFQGSNFVIAVECETEDQQRVLYERFIEEGLQCKIIA